jgi:hypothetical protein
MANGHGGYRQPSNPAPVSGPGALSKRTDGGAVEGMTQPPKYMAGLGYGKGGNMEQQTGAPIQGNDIPATPMPNVSLSQPSMRPEEPITAGIDMGPGPSSAALRLPNTAISPSHTISQIAANDPTGESELLYRALLDRGF